MCGVVGFVGERKPADVLAGAVSALAHRGPDAQAMRYFADSDVFLGHTRLAIIDLSDAGAQPMSDESGDVWITYNGELYNFPELKAELEKRGHRFRSQCDTEVVLRLYLDRGESFVRDLNGIFALAIYDRRRSQLLLARDQLGVKPLYYAAQNGKFAFASEIKALLQVGAVDREVDWQAIYDYFSFLYVPSPRTAFRAVQQLPAAHVLRYDLKSASTTIYRYWDAAEAARKLAPCDHREQLRSLLLDSVRRQLVSDVPIGVFLSGGVDSATLAALATTVSTSRLKTFTVVFEGEGIAAYDEREAAERVARHLNTDHTEVRVTVRDPDEVFELLGYFDQPFGNPTFYLSYLVSKATREHVTVALSGAGGDELFGGYPRYRVLPLAAALSRVPGVLRPPIEGILARVPENPDQPMIRRAKLLARGIGEALPEQYLRWTYFFSDEQKQALLRPLLEQRGPREPSVRVIEQLLRREGGQSLLNRIELIDLSTFLLDNILEYTDKTSMAVGLEARVPFLDPRLVAFSLTLAPHEKVTPTRSKVLLRDAFPELLPKECLQGPKRGFCPPLPAWMKSHFDRYFDSALSREAVRRQGIFDYDVIERLRGEHKAGRRDNSMELFSILVFDRWFRRYVT
jgi:asparagine synthase (glutamine-hydrolysing)